MTTYPQIIKKALKYAKDNPPEVSGLSVKELNDEIAYISSTLLGYGVTAADRLVLNEFRKAYRAELANRSADASRPRVLP